MFPVFHLSFYLGFELKKNKDLRGHHENQKVQQYQEHLVHPKTRSRSKSDGHENVQDNLKIKIWTKWIFYEYSMGEGVAVSYLLTLSTRRSGDTDSTSQTTNAIFASGAISSLCTTISLNTKGF